MGNRSSAAEPNRNLIETDVFEEAVSWSDFSNSRRELESILLCSKVKKYVDILLS